MNTKNHKINTDNLAAFITKFPKLLPIAKILNENKVNWLIGGSSCLFLLGNKRMPDDVDIFLPDIEHDRVDQVLSLESYTHTSKSASARNSNPNGDHSIQFTSHLEFNFDKNYKFSITDTIVRQRISFEHNGININLLPPEDVLIIKALLKRGKDQGKCDIEDINRFRDIYQLNTEYLSLRITELDCKDRVGNIFG